MSLKNQTWAKTRQRLGSAHRQSATVTVIAGLMVFIGTVTQSPARFVYDAATYWAGAVSLAHGHDAFVEGGLGYRGVLTSVLYLPAALATRGFGDSAGGMAVLVQNSLLVSLVGVLLLPRLLRVWGPVTPWMVWVCAGLTWFLVGRTAPYPLTDLWGAALMLAAVVALERHTARGLLGAGLLAGIAFNIRPAYLVALLLAVVVVFFRRRLAGLWFAAGVAVALLPQSIMNFVWGAGWGPWPHGAGGIARSQALLASYVVRFDTAQYGFDPAQYGRAEKPAQYFCSPAMAHAIGAHPPHSAGDLASLYLHNLPQAAIFMTEKVPAALHWPLSTPYLAVTGAADQMFGLLTTAVAVLGVAALVHAQSKSGFRRAPVAVWVAAMLWLGSLATIVASQPETRFALPLILFGIAGCALLVRGKPSIRRVAGAFITVALVFAIGTVGLSHPSPLASTSGTLALCAGG